MSVTSLLPPNRAALEVALEQVTARTLDPDTIATLWDPNTCPAALLPWMAWAYSVDEWDDEWSDDVKRWVVFESMTIHKMKGTPSSIRRVMDALDFGDVDIIEGRASHTYAGAASHDGGIHYGSDAAGWAWYEIRVHKLLSNRQAAIARAMLAAVAPARCHLFALNFTDAVLIHNGVAHYDGAYNYGVA